MRFLKGNTPAQRVLSCQSGFRAETRLPSRSTSSPPVYRRLRFAQQLVRAKPEKKICASIPDECFELRSIMQTVLQCQKLSRYTSITAVINCIKIVRFHSGNNESPPRNVG